MASAYIERARKRLVKERNRAATLERGRILDDAVAHLERAEAAILQANILEEEVK